MMDLIKNIQCKIHEIRYEYGSLRCYLLGHDLRWHQDGTYCERCGMPEGYGTPVAGIPELVKNHVYRVKVKILWDGVATHTFIIARKKWRNFRDTATYWATEESILPNPAMERWKDYWKKNIRRVFWLYVRELFRDWLVCLLGI